MFEKKMAEQEELIEMLQFELRATSPSEKLHNDDHQVYFYTGPLHIQYSYHCLICW